MIKYLKCEVSSQFVEQKMITIKNYSSPNEEETLIYENDEDIEIIEITDLTESEEE